jgi:hypothetical protein
MPWGHRGLLSTQGDTDNYRDERKRAEPLLDAPPPQGAKPPTLVQDVPAEVFTQQMPCQKRRESGAGRAGGGVSPMADVGYGDQHCLGEKNADTNWRTRCCIN